MVTPYRIPSTPAMRPLRVGDLVRLTDAAVATMREHWYCKNMTRQEHERGFYVPPHGTIQALTERYACFPMAYVRWNDPFVPDTWWRVEDLTEAPPCCGDTCPTCHGVGFSDAPSNSDTSPKETLP